MSARPVSIRMLQHLLIDCLQELIDSNIALTTHFKTNYKTRQVLLKLSATARMINITICGDASDQFSIRQVLLQFATGVGSLPKRY